jgi:hypothetical protein
MTSDDIKRQQIEELEQIVKEAESRLIQAKSMLSQVAGASNPYVSLASGPEKVIIGTFNGEYMVDESGKQYPVPANYASKSKLVEGDQLKLTISGDGAFIYKQIGPVPRKRSIGKIMYKDDKFFVQVGTDLYRLLTASITYFKLQPGDEVSILSPLTRKSEWAALENVVKQGGVFVTPMDTSSSLVYNNSMDVSADPLTVTPMIKNEEPSTEDILDEIEKIDDDIEDVPVQETPEIPEQTPEPIIEPVEEAPEEVEKDTPTPSSDEDDRIKIQPW